MASTNKTTNYNLSQFVGTDKPAWLSDYNQDMSKIDTGIHNAATTATGADGKADANTTSIGTLSNLTTAAKTNLVSAINEVDSNADTAQNTATNAQSTALTAKTTADNITNAFNFSQSTSSTVSGTGITIASTTAVRSFANNDGSIGKIYGRIKGTANITNPTVTFTTNLRPESTINVDGICLIYHASSPSDSRAIIKLATVSIASDGTATISATDVPTNIEVNFYIIASLIFAKNLGDIVVE